MTRKTLAAVILFLALAALPVAAFDLDGDLSLTITLKPGRVEFDLAIGLDVERDDLELDVTWKADERGVSSLKADVAYPLTEAVDAQAQATFDDGGLDRLELALDGLSPALGPDATAREAGFVDMAAVFECEETLVLYEVGLDLDPPDLGCLSVTADLTLRDAYVRGTLDLDHDPWDARLRETWRDGALDAREARLSYDAEGFELEETLDLSGFPAVRPVDGNLSLCCDAVDGWSADLDCDHTVGRSGIVVDRLTVSLALDPDPFDLSWRGRFEPGPAGFTLSDVDLTLSAEGGVEPLFVRPKLKLDETGFRSLSIRLRLRFSGG